MKITQTLYVQAIKWSWEDDFKIRFESIEIPTSSDKTVIQLCKHDITIDVPKFHENQFTLSEVAELKEMKAKLISDNEITLQAIDEKIQSLFLASNNKAGK